MSQSKYLTNIYDFTKTYCKITLCLETQTDFTLTNPRYSKHV